MTLDEAIKHVEEVADDWEADAKTWLECNPIGEPRKRADEAYAKCKKCAYEHRQLAEWLKELKQLKEQEPCEDAISRQAMLEIQAKYAEYIGATKFWQMRDEIKALPSITPKSKTGNWIDTGSGQECSECREVQHGYDNFRYFCANCGTKMIKPQEKRDKELDEAIEYYDEYTYTQLAEWLKELRQLREYKLSKGARDKE